jgi:DNA-binding transcriptional ArsR family regulator
VLFRTLADPTRPALFERLCREGEQTVRALTARAGVSQSTVSKHLAVLKHAGLVRDRHEGRRTYSAQLGALAPLVDWTSQMAGCGSALNHDADRRAKPLIHLKRGGAVLVPLYNEVNSTMLKIAETVRPKLIQDGMFLVGLDIVGDKLLEINIFTLGGLNNLSQMYETDFTQTVIEAIEQKLSIRDAYLGKISNRQLATL